jgi:hypothetical protein
MGDWLIGYLPLILLTSTKWWAPAGASKWQIGFNSAFKGLIYTETVEGGFLYTCKSLWIFPKGSNKF